MVQLRRERSTAISQVIIKILLPRNIKLNVNRLLIVSQYNGKLVNQTLQLGKNIKTEKVSIKAWQKIFGKSIGCKSPSTFQSELKRKAENARGEVLMFSTQKTALSQTCLCGHKQKKSLSQRVHHCSICGLKMQRDILSAYLSRYVDPKTETLSIQLARNSWLAMEQSLLDSWQNGLTQSTRTQISVAGAPKFYLWE